MQRAILLGFSLVVVVAAVALGPLGVTSQPAEDSATVSVVSAPSDGLTLEPGRFGSGRYHVEAPPVVVDVADVSGGRRRRDDGVSARRRPVAVSDDR